MRIAILPIAAVILVSACGGSSSSSNTASQSVEDRAASVNVDSLLLSTANVPVGFQIVSGLGLGPFSSDPAKGIVGGASRTLQLADESWSISQFVVVYTDETIAQEALSRTVQDWIDIWDELGLPYDIVDVQAGIGDEAAGLVVGRQCAVNFRRGVVVENISITAPGGMLNSGACDKVAEAADDLAQASPVET